MKKIYYNVLLRLLKGLNVVLMTIPFATGWYIYYEERTAAPFYQNGNFLIIGLFVALYFIFGRVYEAFRISVSRIQEIIYSQTLAALVSMSFMYLVIWLLTKHLPTTWPFITCFATQILISAVWAFVTHNIYFKVFKPQATAIIYDSREGMERLVSEYGMDKKYDVQNILHIDRCLDDLSQLDNVKTVFISGVHSHERNIVLKYCVSQNIDVLVIPRLGDVIMNSAKPIHLFHLPMLCIKRYDATPEYLFAKRFLDIVLAFIGLVVASPIMLITAICIKCYDGGPVIYSQVRLTKDGEEFRIHKFRSMRTDAEKDGVARLSTGDKDDRITPIGRFIRKCRIDELPQIWDIFRGKLSIVGPRPERPEIAKQYMETMPEFALRLQAKAGLTGYAQVYGKYNTAPYDKLQMDLMYIAHPSIVQDAKIVMATIKILFIPDSTEGITEGQTTAERERI